MKTPEQQIEAIRRNLKLDLDAIKMRADLALSVVAQLEAPPQPVRKAREWYLPLTTLIVNSDESMPNGIHVREVLEENEK